MKGRRTRTTTQQTNGSSKRRQPQKQPQQRPLLSHNNDNLSWCLFMFFAFGICLCCINVMIFFYKLPHHGDEEKKWLLDRPKHQHQHPKQQATNHPPTNIPELIRGKERILQLLHNAGVHDVSLDQLKQLPKWHDIVNLYGSTPKIVGLDQCQAYQSKWGGDAAVAPAGAFNSGTNLLAELLLANCRIPARQAKYGSQNRGIRWQVNWGKHSPVELRDNATHLTYTDHKVNTHAQLPGVTIRDPYIWMSSLCRHNYATQWFHSPNHCPNLIPNSVDLEYFKEVDYPHNVRKPQHATNFTPTSKVVGPVRVNYKAMTKYHTSLVHFWNDWYNDYYNSKVSFPRVMVRFEDLMYHPEWVVKEVCHCAGGVLRRDGKFVYITDSAKKGTAEHGSDKTDFVNAIIKYGNVQRRFINYTQDDLNYAAQTLDSKLMHEFGYKHHIPTNKEPPPDDDKFELSPDVIQQFAFAQPPQSNNNNNNNAKSNKNDDKEPVLQRLREGGVSETQLQRYRNELPTWSQIRALYGNGPKIHGLETCPVFRQAVPALDRHLGAAGMFNTGTNLITMLLKGNCIIPERFQHYGPNATKEQYGMRWQVPWGKHTHAKFRMDHAATKATAIIKEHVLPIVLIRNPYQWMKTMCLHSYTANWPHSEKYCPHLTNGNDKKVKVHVRFANNFSTEHESLADLWNDWNNAYMKNATYPRIMIRFEDVIFFQKETTTQVCHCAGGVIRDDRPFHYLVNSAKDGPGHGNDRTGMMDAWIKYGKPPQAFGKNDMEASKSILDQTLMETFGYRHPAT